MLKHVVNFSGGLCSFWAAHRVIERYGKDAVTLLFADTLIEDEDLYTFNRQSEQILGISITRIMEGRNPWQLFREHNMIANAKYPICSIYLKRELLDDWTLRNCLNLNTVIHVGMDWTEEHRIKNLRLEKPDWHWSAPMQEKPIWDKCKMQEEAQKLGLVVPRAYRLGFPHNNCGMRCVRAGISHFVHLYHVLPLKYREWEIEELFTMALLKARGVSNGQFTILKDRRGGVTRPLSLRDLRLRIESGEKFPRDDWGGCGCGVVYQTNNQ